MTPAVRTPSISLVAVLVVVLVLTGCQARLTIDISVARDGSGTLSVALDADDALLAEARAAGVDPLAELAAAGRALEADGWQVTETAHDDGGQTVILAAGFTDPEAFDALAEGLAAGLAAPEVQLVERLTLAADDGLIRFDGAVGAVPGPAVAELGVEPEEAVALAAEHDVFAFDVFAHLPGEVLETNAPQAVSPLRWEVAPGERVELHAVAEAPPALGWWLAALLGLALALAFVGGAWFWALRRRA